MQVFILGFLQHDARFYNLAAKGTRGCLKQVQGVGPGFSVASCMRGGGADFPLVEAAACACGACMTEVWDFIFMAAELALDGAAASCRLGFCSLRHLVNRKHRVIGGTHQDIGHCDTVWIITFSLPPLQLQRSPHHHLLLCRHDRLPLSSRRCRLHRQSLLFRQCQVA